MTTPAQRFLAALEAERPLQIAGVIHAYAAKQAERAGFRALYLSGAGVANASFGLPDLGFTTLDQVAEDTRRICAATALPVLVDIDTGWDDDLGSGRTMADMARAGAAAVQIEDQVSLKRCGHRPGKKLVSPDEMSARIRTAVGTRMGDSPLVMARTDAVAVEGMEAALERVRAYVNAGADLVFAEAVESLEDYRRFADAVPVPVLANLTEFGKTPLFGLDDLREAGIRMALYPLTAFRAMSRTAEEVYRTLRAEGTQAGLLDRMQTRAELYEVLEYQAQEQAADHRLSGSDRSDLSDSSD